MIPVRIVQDQVNDRHWFIVEDDTGQRAGDVWVYHVREEAGRAMFGAEAIIRETETRDRLRWITATTYPNPERIRNLALRCVGVDTDESGEWQLRELEREEEYVEDTFDDGGF